MDTARLWLSYRKLYLWDFTTILIKFGIIFFPKICVSNLIFVQAGHYDSTHICGENRSSFTL